MRTRVISVLLILAVLVVGLTGCSSKNESVPSHSLQIVIAAPFAYDEHSNALLDALSAAAPELNTDTAPLSVTAVATGDTDNDPMGAMAGLTKITAMMASNEIELLLCDADNARRHGDNGETYVPLNELFTEAEIAELGIVPATIPILDDAGNYTGEQSSPCGVDLSGNTALVNMLGISDLGAYVIVDSSNLENARVSIKALLSL